MVCVCVCVCVCVWCVCVCVVCVCVYVRPTDCQHSRMFVLLSNINHFKLCGFRRIPFHLINTHSFTKCYLWYCWLVFIITCMYVCVCVCVCRSTTVLWCWGSNCQRVKSTHAWKTEMERKGDKEMSAVLSDVSRQQKCNTLFPNLSP